MIDAAPPPAQHSEMLKPSYAEQLQRAVEIVAYHVRLDPNLRHREARRILKALERI